MTHSKKENASQKFISLETISAKLLLSATIAALFLSNSSFAPYYQFFFHTSLDAAKRNQGYTNSSKQCPML
jgi:Na+/H+ antiporter NhaA